MCQRGSSTTHTPLPAPVCLHAVDSDGEEEDVPDSELNMSPVHILLLANKHSNLEDAVKVGATG